MNLAHLYTAIYLAQDPDDTGGGGGGGGQGVNEINKVIDNGISMVTMISTAIAVLCFSIVGIIMMATAHKEGGLRKNLSKVAGIAAGAALVGAAALAPIFIEVGKELAAR